jgi:ribonuclease VapC
VVLDASALMAFFEQRSGAGKVEDLILLALRAERRLLLSVVNWGEVYYSTWEASGLDRAKKLRAEIDQLPIEVVDVDFEMALLAAEIRARHRLPYVDSFAAALAVAQQAAVATSDRDFKRVRDVVELIWIN